MNPYDLLSLIVEGSLALAGFAGVVTVLTERGRSGLPPLLRLRLINLLSTSFGALFLSLGSLAMLSAGLDDAFVWKVASAAGLVITIFFAVHSIRTVFSVVGKRRSALVLMVINVPLSIVCLIQVWNISHEGVFWPVFLLLTSLFGVGCFAFTQLLRPIED